jgi:S1-C subfamily serine protease/DNA-directed RNA polymerase subunit RPC12/RpoP
VPIRVSCPSCGRFGRVPEQAVGRTIQCPACSHRRVLTADMVLPDKPEPGAGEPSSPLLAVPPARPAPTATAQTATPSGDGVYGLEDVPVKPAKVTPQPKPVASPRDGIDDSVTAGGLSFPMQVMVGGGLGVAVLSVLAVCIFLARSRGGASDETPATPAAANPQVPAAVAAANPQSPPARAAASPNPTPNQPAPPRAPAAVAAQPPSPPAPPEAAVAETTTPAQEAEAGTISAAAAAGLRDEPAVVAEPDRESEVASQARAGAGAIASRDDGAGKTLSTADIVAESEPSVALIKGNGCSGTGFLVGPGLIATNSHVIDDEFVSDLEVRFVSADEAHKAPLKAELLYEDRARDLAFLAVKTDLKPLRVAKTYAFRKGEDITVIGNPGLGDGQVLENAISRGVMSTKTKIDDKNFYQLGIAVNPGNSGGPVFDSAGRVIGVVTLKSSKQEATCFSIPIEDVQDAIAKLAKQSTADANGYRSRHRLKAAVQGLGGGGALLCVLMDVRREAGGSNAPEVKEAIDKLEAITALMDKEMFPSLASQAPRVASDALVAGTVRSKVREMSENFAQIRDAYAARQSMSENQLRPWKQTHKRLVTELAATLKLEIPAGMLTAFDDHGASRSSIVTLGPQNLGTYGSRLRQRSMLGSPGLPRPPGAIQRPPTLRDRMGPPRRGGR